MESGAGKPRLTLAIEISNPSASAPGDRERGFGSGVALGEVAGGAARVLGKELLRQSDRHDDDLMPAIDRLCAATGARPRDLGRVAVSVGPGGYTALRIAVATAKMLCEALRAECIAVPSALVAARRVDVAGPLAVALASKGESAWIAEFSAGGAMGEGRLMAGADIAGLHAGVLVADRFLPEGIRAAAAARGIRIEPLVFDPAACLEASAALAAIDPLSLAPLYPREPEAVTQWRKRRGE